MPMMLVSPRAPVKGKTDDAHDAAGPQQKLKRKPAAII